VDAFGIHIIGVADRIIEDKVFTSLDNLPQNGMADLLLWLLKLPAIPTPPDAEVEVTLLLQKDKIAILGPNQFQSGLHRIFQQRIKLSILGQLAADIEQSFQNFFSHCYNSIYP
jgi:hypothetical protein